MSAINPEFVERYQLELEKNPRSRVFAPLAEAYRRMGLLDEARRICEQGVKHHPDFVSGRVAFAKVLVESGEFEEALTHLERAVQLSPDNLLAHGLMGEALLKVRRPKDALKAFKMVLFLHPEDKRAQQVVRKWEFLTAEEYDAEMFAMKPLFAHAPRSGALSTRELERALSLADAYTVRNEIEAAGEVLSAAEEALGPHPEIANRLKLLSLRLQGEAPNTDRPVASKDSKARQKALLETFLQRINDRRTGG